ncbi:MAG: PEGA domain-containing protein [Archangium sp.]|nr:PEGA domain-containing protein [Archangium sp.]
MTSTPYIGKYEVLEKVGAGGMAEVFRCRQTGLGGFDKTVIIKRILPNLLGDPEFINMFLDEARLAANLSHPNIVQVFEIDEVDGVPFIVMEYVRGPTLSQVLRVAASLGKLQAGHVVKLLSGVCEGLHYAHHATDAAGQPLGVVHRDVSPQNVIVSIDGTPKLLDFGVAKARGRLASSQVGTLKGKLRYMAPEQISAAEGAVDQRADVYSIGVCLYLGTTGRLPFRGDNDAAVLHAVLKEPLAPPSSIVPGYPPELERLVLWAMARSPADRCPDANTLHLALEDFVATGPFASSKRAVAAWLAELQPELDKLSATQQQGRSGATPSSSALSFPRAEGTPVSKKLLRPNALELEVDLGTAASTSTPRSRAPLLAGVVLALVALAVGLFVALRPTAPVSAPTPEAAPVAVRPVEDQNAAGRAYVAEVERLLGQRRYKAALDILAKARALDATDPAVNIALARLQDQAELEDALTRARELQANGELGPALAAAREVLERDPDNAEARALISALKPKPAPAPMPGRALQTGSLLVTATPEATVYVDDERVGTTPLKLAKVAAGSHAIEVRAKGYAPTEQDVKVQPGREARLAVVLVKSRAAPEPLPAPAAPEAPKVGLLVVTSQPEAAVSIDGAPRGRTPVRAAGVAPGSHLVELNEPGYVAASKRVEVIAGQDASAAFELVAERTEAPKPTPAPVVPVATPAVKKPRLPATYTAHNVKDLARVLSVVESEASATGGQPMEKVSRTTAGLMDELSGTFAPGQTVELFPRGMYYLIVSEASKGVAPAAIAEHLRAAHLRNELADFKP